MMGTKHGTNMPEPADPADAVDARAARPWAPSALVRRLAAGFADLLAPPVCLACHARIAAHDALCAGCWREIVFIRPPLCDRLGLPLPFGGDGPLISAAAAANPPPYARARAAVVFDGPARRLIHAFKYADRHEPRRLLARWLAGAGSELLRDADCLVPVPITRWRLVRRQFNQASLLAHELSRLTGVPTEPTTLARVRGSRPQVGASRSERERNVQGAFAVARGRRRRIAGRRVLLIDDVITTGATIAACTQALTSAGAARVDVLAVAMVTSARVVSP